MISSDLFTKFMKWSATDIYASLLFPSTWESKESCSSAQILVGEKLCGNCLQLVQALPLFGPEANSGYDTPSK